MSTRSTSEGGLRATLRDGGVPLAVIVSLGIVARIIQLNSSYWTDEILALQRSFRLPLAEIVTSFFGDTHHPLYAVMARMSLVAFGEAPWAVRLPAMLFGVAAIGMTWAVAADRKIKDGGKDKEEDVIFYWIEVAKCVAGLIIAGKLIYDILDEDDVEPDVPDLDLPDPSGGFPN